MVSINSFYLLEDEEKNPNQLTEVCKSIIKENAAVTAAKREAKAKKAREKKRNWADMPRDILSLIFMKLGAMGILYRAQSVCSSWRKLSKDPSLFQSINMCKNEWEFLFRSLQLNINSYGAGDYIEVRKIAQVAVDRSCGQLAELFLDNFCTNEILHYALDRSNFLKRLRLTPDYFYGFPNDIFNVLTKRVSFLEELDLCGGLYSIDVFKQLCGLCSQLKCLRLDSTSNPLLDEVAVAIADTKAQLLRLHLSGTTLLTDIGLQALLDGCRYLEILDLGQCIYTNIGEELQKKCKERIKCFVFPAVTVLPVPDDVPDGEYNSGPACGCSCYCCCSCGEPEDEDLPDDSVFLPKKLATCYL
ncbi:F-box protein skip19 [Thalictrum thalictroides]|uniref:F-box protein skip19 n=1 Tax=Thalictrum thalictroides TaxID=46969 RepID=A0A7J6X3M7_THATH|nr:F-box protein skip19 [Thalictrum thalictroides]